jgi:hypothetical protein
MRFRRMAYEYRLGWGLPHASERSLQQRVDPQAGRRIPASADRTACTAFFELTQRAVRIAPRDWHALAATDAQGAQGLASDLERRDCEAGKSGLETS